MTSQQIEPTIEAEELAAPADIDRSLSKSTSGVMAFARRSGGTAKRGASRIAAHLPSAVQATRIGAQQVSSALQALPDRTLRSLAASSVGLGAGLHVSGAPRVLVVAAVAPAVIMGATIALRPPEPVVPSGSVG